MTQLVASSLAERRLALQLVVGFAGAALLLAALGLYGVLAYAASQRTKEMGIRMALGAQPGDLSKLVLWPGMKLASLGAGIGLVSALVLTRSIAHMLYETEPFDPLTFGIGTAVLLCVALLACWLPAQRAAQVDPMISLKTE